MAHPDTRRTLASRRRADRDRKRRQREKELEARVPSYQQIDMALSLSVREMIVDRYGTAKQLPKDSDLHRIVERATFMLGNHGFKLSTEKARSRMRRAIGA